MKRIISFPLEDGGVLPVAVEVAPEDYLHAHAGLPDLVDTAKIKFEEAVSKVASPVVRALARLAKLVDAPDKVEVRFAIAAEGKGGAEQILTLAGKGELEVTLTWERT